MDSGMNTSASGAAMATSRGERGRGVVAVVAADANGEGGVSNADASVAQADEGNGGVLTPRGDSGDVADTKGRQDLLPTPVLARRAEGDVIATGLSGGQWRDGGDGERVSQGDGVAFVSHQREYSFEREEGWVDQYTNSSLGAATPSETSSCPAEEDDDLGRDDLAPAV